ncbi:uncharacterized protein TNCV_555901 [Trichonephila clavipes]|uniref:Uncharacterized protein n=1 Tax=Trichonephila clavipes TaxID=2585209 RepID=A0A8X6RMB9_TRICX|nr:uncharacterized protein TNCV_555901 [Trichonephila clavipes]
MAEWLWHRTSTTFAKVGHSLASVHVVLEEQQTESYRQLQKPLERWQAFDPTGILHHSPSIVLRNTGRQVGRVDELQFVGQEHPTHALLDSSPNDIPIDVACHRCTLNMQVSSGTMNNSSTNEPSCTTVTVSFNGVLLVETGTWRSPY